MTAAAESRIMTYLEEQLIELAEAIQTGNATCGGLEIILTDGLYDVWEGEEKIGYRLDLADAVSCVCKEIINRHL